MSPALALDAARYRNVGVAGLAGGETPGVERVTAQFIGPLARIRRARRLVDDEGLRRVLMKLDFGLRGRLAARPRGLGPGKVLGGALGDQVALDLGEHPATDRAARVR